MTIYDSVKKTKLPFVSLQEGKVSLYVCGPTVYDDAHLGHAKSALVFDLLRRVLEAEGYEVLFARNITDIDDKIINKARELGISTTEIAAALYRSVSPRYGSNRCPKTDTGAQSDRINRRHERHDPATAR